MFPSSSRSRTQAISRKVVGLGVLLAAGLLVSCTSHAPKAAVPPAAAKPALAATKPAPLHTIEAVPVTSEQRLGTIRVIGARGSFVLIETPSAAVTASIPAGHLIHCRAPGTSGRNSSSDLRVSPERRQPFLVADVLNGLPSVGDVAYLAKEAPPLAVPFRPVPLAPMVPAAAPPPAPDQTPYP